jgi:hypothetical protein
MSKSYYPWSPPAFRVHSLPTSLNPISADVSVSNQSIRHPSRIRITPSCLKELLFTYLLGFGSPAILHRAVVFERVTVLEQTSFVQAGRSGGGGYRSRTDDPLLAKQVL